MSSPATRVEHRWGLPPLTDPAGRKTRDGRVLDLFTALLPFMTREVRGCAVTA